MVILAAGLIAFFTVSHAAKIQKLKAKAEFILVLSGKEAYLPCRVGEAPFQFDPPPRNALTPIDKSLISDSDFPEGKWDGEHRFELVGYNEFREEMTLMDYIVRGVKVSDLPDVVLRGRKLDDDHSEGFLTRGIRCGDSMEDIRQILGEADKAITPDWYEIYCFDEGISGQDRICAEYIDRKLRWIKLGYTDALAENQV